MRNTRTITYNKRGDQPTRVTDPGVIMAYLKSLPNIDEVLDDIRRVDAELTSGVITGDPWLSRIQAMSDLLVQYMPVFMVCNNLGINRRTLIEMYACLSIVARDEYPDAYKQLIDERKPSYACQAVTSAETVAQYYSILYGTNRGFQTRSEFRRRVDALCSSICFSIFHGLPPHANLKVADRAANVVRRPQPWGYLSVVSFVGGLLVGAIVTWYLTRPK
jgi:hypothetical protein